MVSQPGQGPIQAQLTNRQREGCKPNFFLVSI